MAAQERLQKVLARGGIASRRAAEELIAAGRVRVNGRVVTELGTRVDPRDDKVEVDGRRVLAEPLVYYVFHKPRGVVSTLSDPEGRPTLREYVSDIDARLFPVGRLDFHTSGALLLTNDGELAQALLHPRRSVPKTYVAKVRGVPTDLQLDPMRNGMTLPPVPGEDEDKGPTRPADVEVLRHSPTSEESTQNDGTTWLRITLREGRNRQIHRMAEAVGLFVMRLARLSFAGISNDGLRPGEKRSLSEKEITALRATFLRAAEMARGAQGSGAELGEGPRRGGAGSRTVGAGPARGPAPRARTADALRGREGRDDPPGDRGALRAHVERRDGSARGAGASGAPRESSRGVGGWRGAPSDATSRGAPRARPAAEPGTRRREHSHDRASGAQRPTRDERPVPRPAREGAARVTKDERPRRAPGARDERTRRGDDRSAGRPAPSAPAEGARRPLRDARGRDERRPPREPARTTTEPARRTGGARERRPEPGPVTPEFRPAKRRR